MQIMSIWDGRMGPANWDPPDLSHGCFYTSKALVFSLLPDIDLLWSSASDSILGFSAFPRDTIPRLVLFHSCCTGFQHGSILLYKRDPSFCDENEDSEIMRLHPVRGFFLLCDQSPDEWCFQCSFPHIELYMRLCKC